jgi:hypothetical protein
VNGLWRVSLAETGIGKYLDTDSALFAGCVVPEKIIVKFPAN